VALHEIAAHPTDPAPARKLGDDYMEQNRPFEALWAFSQSLQARQGEPAATVGLAKALAAGLLPGKAIEKLRQVLAREPGPASIRPQSGLPGYPRSGWTRFGGGADSAGGTGAQRTQRVPGGAGSARGEAVAELAELYLRTGQPQEALSVLEKDGKEFVARPEGALIEGRTREALGDLVGAEAAYRRSLGIGSQGADDAPGWHRLGLLYLSSGGLADARQALQKAHSLDGADPALAVDLGRVEAVQDSPKSQSAALDLFREAVRSRPYAPAYYQGGLLMARSHRLPEAAGSYARAIATDREFADAYRELADLQERTGHIAEAHYQRGLYYSVKDLRVPSSREYRAMAKADPSRPTGLMMASQSHFKMFQYAPAMSLAREALARHPNSREAREQLAAVAMMVGDRKEAARQCQSWLRDDPGATSPLLILARAAVEDLRHAEGIRYYEQVLAKEPDNALCLEGLGEALLAAPGGQQLPRAVATLTRAAALEPTDAKTRYQLGLALMRAGRLEEAERQMLRSLDLDPNRGATYNTVVQLAHRLRQPGMVSLFSPMVRDVEARLRDELALWRHTWDQPEDAAGYLAMARFLIRTANPARAESQLEWALRLRPGWKEAETELARVRRLRAVL
jgi:tetratricopeptide (TPR) repeat protein